jgi:hypothetical protein
MRISSLLFLASVALMVSNGPSFACPDKGSIFQDSFTDQSGGWENDPGMKFGSTGLQVAVAPGKVSDAELNATFYATDGDFCTDAVFPKVVPNTAFVGLIFWATDYNNYYMFQITTAGRAQFYRRLNGNWISIFDAANPAIKTAAAAANEIRVVAKNNMSTFYVNGQKITNMRGQPPQSPNARFGYYVQLDATAPADGRTFGLKNYTVNAAP